MEYRKFGNNDKPALVCIPGLLGGPENFEPFLPDLTERFQVFIIDPNANRRELGLNALSAEQVREVSYATTSQEIVNILRDGGCDNAYLFGISLGGKIVYDFAIRCPERFLGGLITDVGVDPFEDSELFRLIHGFVDKAPLHLPWPQMKEALRAAISDRSLCSLIQTQLYYPDQKPPAIWRTGMANFEVMLKSQSISHQYDDMRAVDSRLANEGRFIHVLESSRMSGISHECRQKMLDLKSIRLYPITDSGHFMHVTHKDVVLKTALEIMA